MTVLLTGVDGYLGWPTALRLADRLDDRVVGVDNLARREWVAESGSVSAIPIEDPEERFGDVDGVSFVEGDLTDREFVSQLLEMYDPDTVLHAAAQPSAPYSSINGERALYTQRNNVSMGLNLLYGLHEAGLEDAHFIETTTTGVYGAPEFPIPEGGATMENRGERDEVPFPAMGGSWYHQCYDDETEILTRDGWKPFPELSDGDQVMSMDFETGETGWQEPSEIQSYEYSGELVTVSNRRVDLKVTPNHRMLVGTSWANEGTKTFENRREIVRADELGDEYQYPCFFTTFPDWNAEPTLINSYPPQVGAATDGGIATREGTETENGPVRLLPWLKFFGWWLTEGTVGKEDQTNNVRIYQSDVRGLEHLFENAGYEHLRTGQTDGADYLEVTDKTLADYLRRLKDNRRIPRWMRNLPKADLRILLDSLIDGDGSERPDGRGYRFYTSSKQLADHVQEIALKVGYSANIHSNDRRDTDGWQQNVEYCVNINTESWCVQTNQGGDAFGTEQYDGTVYCCTVDGGIVLVRRNGKPVWSGNSKTFDAANMRLAQTEFGLDISDVRTAIVYGIETTETVDRGSPTRFDFDYYFGTVVNRFCAQAVAGYPITVYGKGEQRKPMVSLQDAVESLANLVERGHEGDGVTVYNQVTRPVAIVELAETIADVAAEFDLDAEVKHYENPREEDEEHKMTIENDRFEDLVGGQQQTLEEGVRDILGTLVEHRDRITAHEDRFLPGVLSD